MMIHPLKQFILKNFKQDFRKINTHDMILWPIFVVSTVVIFIAVISAMFPALIVRTFGGGPNFAGIDPFMIGQWMYPILVANFVVLGLGIFYYKKKIPQILNKSIKFVFNLEVPSSVATLTIVILLGIYIFFSVEEIFKPEVWDDYGRLKNTIANYDITQVSGFGWHVKFFLLNASYQLFGFAKVFAFVGSVGLLVLTYLVTAQITKKKFAGLVAMVVLMQSGTLLTYDDSITYSNFWIIFYLFSLYLINRAWPFSPVSFILSIFSKPMTGGFLPVTLFFIARSNISRKKKIFALIAYAVLLIGGIVFVLNSSGAGVTGVIYPFDNHTLWKSFNAIGYQLRYDGLMLMFAVPLIVGLFFAARKGVLHADSFMMLITASLLLQPILTSITTNNSEPYRFMPFVVFFAIGVGILLSKNFRPTIRDKPKLEKN